MPGWVPFDADWWPVIIDSLPDVWPVEAARFDLRWHYDQRGRIPSRRVLAKRWGWTDGRVRGLLRNVASWWDDQKGVAPLLAAPRTQAAPSGTHPAPSGTHPAPKLNGASQAMRQDAPSGAQAAPSGAHLAPSGNHTRVDPPSPSPSPSPSRDSVSSGKPAYTSLFEQVKLSDGEPTDPRRWRVWAFKLSEDAWHTYRQTHHRIKPRALKWSGKASSDGGSLWRMVDSRASFEQFKAVLLWLDSSEHQRATFYRDSQQTLVTIRRHLEELHGLAIDEANQLTEQQQRDQRYSRADEQDPEALRASAEKLRRWVAEQQEQRT